MDANSDLLQNFFNVRPLDISINYCVGNQLEYE